MEQQVTYKTFRYKLMPTPPQGRERERVLGLCRRLSNAAIEQRKVAWERRRVSLSRYQQEAELKDIRAERPEYATVHSHVPQDVLTRLDSAFRRFFARVKAGEKSGYPGSQGAGRYDSFAYKQFDNGAHLENNFLVLSKIGRIAMRWTRPLEGSPKTVTISNEVDGWYVSFSCADVPIQPLPDTGQETGVELGLEAFATLADGTRIFHPGWYRRAERALKTAQRRVNRRKKGSARRRKAVKLLAKAHQQVRRQRADFRHKTAVALVRTNDAIYHENVQTANMLKNYHLATSISDAGWSQFLSIRSFKAAHAGRTETAVNPAFASQVCSGCGVLAQTGLSVRWHRCPECGMSLHRDHNAAKNREQLGRSRRGGVAIVASENRASARLSSWQSVKTCGRCFQRGPADEASQRMRWIVYSAMRDNSKPDETSERIGVCHTRRITTTREVASGWQRT
jgi:putative transposase